MNDGDSPIKPITANKERRAVHAFLEWASERDLISGNPCRKVPQFRLRKGETAARDRFYEDTEVLAILTYLPQRYRQLVRWAWCTGMRLSECLNLRWSDLDTLVRVQGKGRKVRHLPMSRSMIGILQEIPQVEVGPFPFTRDVAGQAFRRARVRAEIPDGDFHALRRTFAVNYLRAGGDIYRLSKILGHSSVVVTEKKYAHLVSSDLKSGMDAVDVGRILAESPAEPRKKKSRNRRN